MHHFVHNSGDRRRDEAVVESQRFGEQARDTVNWSATDVIRSLPNTNVDPLKTGRMSTGQVIRESFEVRGEMMARGPHGLLLTFFSSSGFFLFFFRVPTPFLAGLSFFLLAPRCAARCARPHARTEIPACYFFLLVSHCAARHARLHARAFPSLHTDDRRTNDATCGPQAWLTGRLHDGGTRSVRSPLRRAPLLATPIATPLQCGRPKRPGL